MSKNQDIKNASIDALLGGLAGHTSDSLHPVDKWLKSEELFPGTTPTRAQDLLDAYRAWEAESLDKKLHANAWGARMKQIFRNTKTRTGQIYYTSKTADPAIPARLLKK